MVEPAGRLTQEKSSIQERFKDMNQIGIRFSRLSQHVNIKKELVVWVKLNLNLIKIQLMIMDQVKDNMYQINR